MAIVIELHERILARSGGTRGILHAGAIHSAIERCCWGPFEDDGSLAERAAFLLRGIAQDHPFADGNKRTAYEAADSFLGRNGAPVAAEADAVITFMLDVAQGRMGIPAMTAWFHDRIRKG